MKLSITIEGMFGLNWKHWQHLVAEIERMGFAGLYRSDHFATKLVAVSDERI
jgi:hypothetical protein